MTTFALASSEPGLWKQIFNFDSYGELLSLLHNSVIAGAVLGIIGGLISVFVMMRDLPFAVHGISELSFAGAAGALLIGVNVVVGAVTGSLLAAVVIGALGVRARERNSIIGVLMPFGLGLGVLFLSLYKGRSANKFWLLTGQIVAIDTPQLSWLIAIGLVVSASLFLMWRPLRFASLDPEVAAARGVPVRLLSPIFMLVLGLAIAASVQVVGALLVLSIVCTPAAAAMVGGTLLALGSSIPISPYVTTISFAFYVVCRLIGSRRGRRRGTERAAEELAVPVPEAAVPAHHP